MSSAEQIVEQRAEQPGPGGTRTFRYSNGRLMRNLVGLLPLVGFPLVLHELGATDPVLIGLFGLGAIALVVGVVLTAVRFRLTVEPDALVVRGKLRTRRVEFAAVERFEVRRGRGKPSRFMGPPPFRELWLHTAERRLVISSLRLGEDAFEELVGLLSARLAPAG